MTPDEVRNIINKHLHKAESGNANSDVPEEEESEAYKIGQEYARQVAKDILEDMDRRFEERMRKRNMRLAGIIVP